MEPNNNMISMIKSFEVIFFKYQKQTFLNEADN